MNFIDKAIEQKLKNDDFLQAMANIDKEPEVREILNQYPEYIQDVITIIDYDTALQMDGIEEIVYGSLSNQYKETIKALKRSGNVEDAEILKEARKKKKKDADEFEENSSEFYDRLSINHDYDKFWDRVRAYIDENHFVFEQNLDTKNEVKSGGPFLIELLFKCDVSTPKKEDISSVLERKIGKVECFSEGKGMTGFAAIEHKVEFQDTKVPVQFMIMDCMETSKEIDAFELSQMWDCMEDKERIFEECKYQVVATDMLAAGLDSVERANLDMDFLEALMELYPDCEAVYFQNCGKLVLAEDVRNHGMEGLDRYIRFGVNARFFNIQGSEDMVVDTVGMSTLFMPDIQYHFHAMDPNQVVNHAYNLAFYLLANDNPIENGESIDGILNGRMCQDIRWYCRYEDALIQPVRTVLDVEMGEYASGQR